MRNGGRRIGIAIAGGAVLLIGLIAIPYPGPGWLIVFAGLGILSTEFEWAKRLLAYAKTKYDAWQSWVRSQPFYIKIVFWVATFMLVVLTIWLFNGYGILNNILNLNMDWLNSPVTN